jgi:predicted XRE-type DNA-binding protein
MHAKSEPIFEESSGNVFADFDLPDADEHLAKADLAHTIRQRIKERALTQTQASRLLGTSQGRVSELFQGHISKMTYDRLIGFLNALDCDVRIIVTPREVEDTAHGRTLVSRG